MADLTVSTSISTPISAPISTSEGAGLTTDKVPLETVNKAPEAAFKNSVSEKITTQNNAQKVEEAEKKEKTQPVEEVEATVEEVNAFMQSMQRNLSFSIDEQLGQAIISVKDGETDEVIRQIPSEELVVLRKKMDDVVGILFEAKV